MQAVCVLLCRLDIACLVTQSIDDHLHNRKLVKYGNVCAVALAHMVKSNGNLELSKELTILCCITNMDSVTRF